jgi:DNA replication protein DnaC
MAVDTECPLCNGTRWQTVDQRGVSGVVRCECTKRNRLDRLMRSARIPERYTHCELDAFDTSLEFMTPAIDQAKFLAEKYVEEYPMSPPMGLMFMGQPGVGKTHLAVGIIKRLIREKGVPCLFRTFPELLKEIQNSYNPVSKASELSLLGPVLDAEVLVLDEIGAQNPSSWVKDTVGYVLNYRYNENRVTILTTNFLDEESRRDARKGTTECLTDRIGDRMRSRLYEMCKAVSVVSSDYRLHVKQAEHHFNA